MPDATTDRHSTSVIDPLRLVRVYVWVLGVGLLLDGSGLVAMNALGAQAALNTTDTAQNLLHMAWGVVLLVVAFVARGERELWIVWASVISGAFSVALAILGVTLTNPFGLQLGPGENAFHFTVGLLALLLGAWALRTAYVQPVPLRTAARPAELRNGPVSRRRARRRPGKARGRQHRR